MPNQGQETRSRTVLEGLRRKGASGSRIPSPALPGATGPSPGIRPGLVVQRPTASVAEGGCPVADPLPELDGSAELDRSVDEAELDRILAVLADFADLKSPYFLGHSRGVAELARRAAVSSGNTSRDVKLVWRAGLVHDIGRAGVPNTIWDKPTPLTASEAERIRLHD